MHVQADTDVRARSVELREKEWDLAARVGERALADAREHVNVLMKDLATDRAELRAREARIADLESQPEEHRRQLATVIARAIAKNRVPAVKRPKRKNRLLRKQADLEIQIMNGNGSVATERDLEATRRRLIAHPQALNAVLQTARALKRTPDTVSVRDVTNFGWSNHGFGVTRQQDAF